MRRRIGRRASWCGVILSLMLLPVVLGGGPGEAASARPAVTAKRMVAARTSATFGLPSPAYLTVQSVTLPAGAWTVMGKATAINFGSTDFVRCRLYDVADKTVIDSATYQVGTPSPRAVRSPISRPSSYRTAAR
jgi:hypothetical protein